METASTGTLTIQAIAAYLQNRTAGNDTDKKLWANLQSILSGHPDLLRDFEKYPDSDRLQNDVRQAMEEVLNRQPATRQTFEALLKQRETMDSAAGIRVENSKNTLINSQLNAGGNIHIGDVTHG